MNLSDFTIDGRAIGTGHPTYFVAELSANHNGSLDRALAIVRAAAEAGADAIKLQTYRADTITIESDRPEFRVDGTIWEGRTLHDLYEEAHTPWEWHEPIFREARRLGLHAFSAPFDGTAVDFLEGLGVPVWKIASSELVDIPLLRRIAKTGKPVILSTGMAVEGEIREAVDTLRAAGCSSICLLKCTAAYPAPLGEANLALVPRMRADFGLPVGLSDHTAGHGTAVVAAALGACLVEKHFTLDRADGGPDAAFSMEPGEFKAMVDAVREAEASLGGAEYGPTESEAVGLRFRRSLYVVRDLQAGARLTAEDLRSIRPAAGLHPRYLDRLVGHSVAVDVPAGTPLSREMLADSTILDEPG